MSGLRIVWVGKTKLGYARQGVEFYQKRIAPFYRIDWVEIRAAAHSEREPGAAVALESEAILKKLGEKETVVLLDETGRQISTKELAGILGNMAGGQTPGLTFVLGGAFGVDKRVKARVDKTIALSKMTFPHQMARLILLEQIYRAGSLNAGHGYHHE